MALSTYKTLREDCLQAGITIEPGKPVLRNVKVLGFESVNRRRYLREAVEQALCQYEGKAINLDHPDEKAKRRSILDRFGRLEECYLAEDGIRANLPYNPEHPRAKQIAWAAEHQPETLGLSHDAVGQGHTDASGVFIIDKIVAVRAVDLVADPATTKGLYESMEPEPVTPEAEGEGLEAQVGKLIVAILQDTSMDKSAKKAKVLQALKLCDDGEKPAEKEEKKPEGEKPPEEKPEEKKPKESIDPAAELAQLKAEKTARKLCEAAKLPATAVTEAFLESMVAVGTEAKMRSLIEDRKAIVNKPRSAGAGSGQTTLTTNEFASRLRAR